MTVLLLLGLAAPAGAQCCVASSSGLRQRPIAWQTTTPFQWLPVSRGDMWTLNHYLANGSMIGIAGGLAWGIATDHRKTRALDIAGDAAIGWVVGMAGGAVVYIIHQASHH